MITGILIVNLILNRLRATKFLFKNIDLSGREVNALTDVVESYIRAAYVKGKIQGLEEAKSLL